MTQTTNYEITTDIESSATPTVSPVEVGAPTETSHAVNQDYLSGIGAGLKNNISASSDPTATDDNPDGGYSVGSIWVNTTSNQVFICVDSTNDAAIWNELIDNITAQTISGNKTFSNNVIVTGDFSVNGTMDVTDSNITVNNGGDQATADANDAGITVEMSDATDALIHYDSSATGSKWKCGESGSTKEIVTISDSQVITNKDVDGGTASNTSRITVPKAAKTTLDGLTRKAGTIVYDTTNSKFWGDDGASLADLSASANDVPVGTIVAWIGGYFGDGSNGSFTNVLGNTVANVNSYLASNWRVCDGSALNDGDSPIFNGASRYLPNLTDDRFLMGDTAAANIGGSSTTPTTAGHALTQAETPAHTHSFEMSTTVNPSAGGTAVRGTGASGANCTTTSVGSGDSHTHGGGGENRPLYLSCFYIMKVKNL